MKNSISINKFNEMVASGEIKINQPFTTPHGQLFYNLEKGKMIFVYSAQRGKYFPVAEFVN